MSMGPPPSDQAKTRRWLRLDLTIAIVALLFSGLAALSTWYQTKIVSDQLSAAVWPYLGSSTTSSARLHQVSFGLRNDGTGPAILRGVEAYVGERAFHSYDGVLAALGISDTNIKRSVMSESSLDYGEVIRAGEQISFLTVQDPAFVKRVMTSQLHVGLRVCYCSILGHCWIYDTRASDPQSIGDCSSFHRESM